MLSHKLIFSQPYHAEWTERELPDPGPGELLIRTRKTLISTGTELTSYTGDFPPDSVWARYIQYPFPDVGYSNVGEIIALGSDVTEYEIGQRVASLGRHASHNLMPFLNPYGRVQVIPDGVTDD